MSSRGVDDAVHSSSSSQLCAPPCKIREAEMPACQISQWSCPPMNCRLRFAPSPLRRPPPLSLGPSLAVIMSTEDSSPAFTRPDIW
jgi:hypothetical protein